MLENLAPYKSLIEYMFAICVGTSILATWYIIKAMRMPPEAREMRGTPLMRFFWLFNKTALLACSIFYGVMMYRNLNGLRNPLNIQLVAAALILTCLFSSIATSLLRLYYDLLSKEVADQKFKIESEEVMQFIRECSQNVIIVRAPEQEKVIPK